MENGGVEQVGKRAATSGIAVEALKAIFLTTKANVLVQWIKLLMLASTPTTTTPRMALVGRLGNEAPPDHLQLHRQPG